MPARSRWGVTVLQAIEAYDAGAVWALHHIPLDVDQRDTSKSELYRGSVTRAAITATLAATSRVQRAAIVFELPLFAVLQIEDFNHWGSVVACLGVPIAFMLLYGAIET